MMGLEGKLADMPVLDLLRVFQRSARSGKLVLRNESRSARVWLREGQVVRAIVLAKPEMRLVHAGEEAIFNLFTWPNGDFCFSPDPASNTYPITIKRPTSELIVEALQRRKAESGQRSIPELTLQTPLCAMREMAGLNERIRLSTEEWSVLMRIGQQTTARQVVAQTGLAPARVLMIVDHLIACGLIMCVPLANLPQRQITVERPEPVAGRTPANTSITNLTKAIRRRLQQIAVGA